MLVPVETEVTKSVVQEIHTGFHTSVALINRSLFTGISRFISATVITDYSN